MFDLESIVNKLADSEPVKNAMNGIAQIRDVFIKSMIRIDKRFDDLEAKSDRIIFHLENPSRMVPAGPDGLLEALARVSIEECPIDGCTNTAVHTHDELRTDGVHAVLRAVQAKPKNLLPFSTAESKVG